MHQKNWVCHIYCQINAKKTKKKQACLLGINVSLTISFLCRLHVSVNLFSILDVFENHYFISATK